MGILGSPYQAASITSKPCVGSVDLVGFVTGLWGKWQQDRGKVMVIPPDIGRIAIHGVMLAVEKLGEHLKGQAPPEQAPPEQAPPMATPAAKLKAEELGVDLSKVKIPEGAGGLIRLADVYKHLRT